MSNLLADTPDSTESFDLIALSRALWDRKWFIGGGAAVGTLAALVAAFSIQPTLGRWFQRDGGTGIMQGDAIVVSLDVDQPLARWNAVTQIIYNLAIAAAAVSSF